MRATKWQPIESAPRDGTPILGRYSFVNKRANYETCYRVRRMWWGKVDHAPLYGWRTATDDEWTPTHWKPIRHPNA